MRDARLTNERILIIDDDPQFLKTYQRILQPDGYVIDTAGDRASALDKLDRHTWDTVLLDQRLQGPYGPDSGLDLITEITRRSPSALIIVITAYPQRESIERAFHEGVYDYLIKDEHIQFILRAKIRNALHYTRERRLNVHSRARLQAELNDLWQQARTEDDRNRKGKLLEDLMVVLFKLIPGLDNGTPRKRSELEEIDLLVPNESDDPFWQKEGTYILVECKNWSKPVGVPELQKFMRKMEHRFDRCRLGIFVSPQAFTGPFEDELRAARRSNQLVIAIDGATLEKLIAAEDKNKALKELHGRAIMALNGALDSDDEDEEDT